MENHYFQWVNPLQMAIFNSYVSLPEGNTVRVTCRFCCDGEMAMVQKNPYAPKQNSHPLNIGITQIRYYPLVMSK
jgi:hypothetical protein